MPSAKPDLSIRPSALAILLFEVRFFGREHLIPVCQRAIDDQWLCVAADDRAGPEKTLCAAASPIEAIEGAFATLAARKAELEEERAADVELLSQLLETPQ